MNIMVIGSGGREHAIIKKIKESKQSTKIYVVPGNIGMAKEAICVDIDITNLENVVAFALNAKIDFAIVTPDNPLVQGMVDRLESAGICCFGPIQNAAILEGSKIFAKNLMQKYGIPTAKFATFTEIEKALEYITQLDTYPIVLKADGLALGKGVIIAKSKQEANTAIVEMMQDKIFGESGCKIVIEEFLSGQEVSVLTFTDGKTILPMISSMDFKRALDGDAGLNTGGMGTIAPNPYYTEEIAEYCMQHIFQLTVDAMLQEGRRFKGCLYFGLMITKNGPKVIEYNCRFGDPETQVILPLLKSDLLALLLHTANGTLENCTIEFSKQHACCVIMASKGYPQKYQVGYEIDIPQEVEENIYFAGVKEQEGKLVTNGGRVLGVIAVADNLQEAIEKSYEIVAKINFKEKYYRKDIGKKALNLEG